LRVGHFGGVWKERASMVHFGRLSHFIVNEGNVLDIGPLKRTNFLREIQYILIGTRSIVLKSTVSVTETVISLPNSVWLLILIVHVGSR
jgi:hypothetical protein